MSLCLCLGALPAQVLPFVARAQAAECNEAALVSAALSGERSAQHQLYELHYDRVYACVARLLGRVAEADDVVQDAFVAAFGDLNQLGDQSRFGPWLRGIAVHQVHRRLRKRRLLRRLALDRGCDDATLAGAATRSASPDAIAMLKQVDAALRNLPPRQRLAWMLRHVEGHALEEVADHCRISLATVKRQLAKAETELRRHIDFEAPTAATKDDDRW